jgi:hypothetical protein
LTGYRAKAAKNALAVDNFLVVFFINEINDFLPKSWKLRFFIYFLAGRALFQCPRPVRAQNTRISGDQWCQHAAYSGAPFDPNLSGFSADFCAWLGEWRCKTREFGPYRANLRLYMRFLVDEDQKSMI